jgi:hypothetical protein
MKGSLTRVPFFLAFFLVALGFELRAYALSHSISPLFVTGFFQGRVLQIICPGWL